MIPEQPALSVILTVWNRTGFLGTALASALKQTREDIEIIVADDSTDPDKREDVARICANCGDPRAFYHRNSGTPGVVGNIQSAIKMSKAEFIAFLNDDDIWESTFTSELLAPLEQDSLRDLAFSDHWIINEQGELQVQSTDRCTEQYGRKNLPEGTVGDLAELVLVRNGVPLAMASVIRKDAIDWSELVPQVSGAYDYWISCLLAASHCVAYYVPKRLSRYRIHAGMETARKAPDKNLNMIYIYETLLHRRLFPDRSGLIRRKLAMALYQVGKDNMSANKSRARALFLKSFLTYPSWKPCIQLARCIS